ncbi:MAG: LLM class flavin-dependent oxidoreductase [Chloroflexi bacterium]|nr:LLM class flavin-dependent oxidoreductase [Chloroflexota bacterium]
MKFDYYILNTYIPEVDGPANELYAKWLEQAALADELGYDTLWVTEHHFRIFGGMSPNPQIMLAAMAGRTRRIRLGTAVSILPLHHPLRIAEDMAMLDNLTNGRLEVGIGRGMPQAEYEIYGAGWEESQELLEEAAGILVRAWVTPDFTWSGKHYRYERPVTLLPPTLQQPGPPIWVTANFDESHFRWIGKMGFNLMTLPWVLPDFGESRRLINAYRSSLREHGHDVSSHQVLAMFPTHVGASDAEARATGERLQAGMFGISSGERGGQLARGLDFDRLVSDSRVLVGDAAACRDHVSRVRDELGITHLACLQHYGAAAQPLVLESMRRFAEDVAPAFR